MKNHRYKTEKTISNYYDSETGEITDTEEDVKHQKIILDDKESFAIVYASIIGALDNLDKASRNVLDWCVINSNYNSNKIALAKPNRKEISEKYGVGDSTVKNCIAKLKKKKILIAIGSGIYRINPKYFWRGDKHERKKTMKYILEVECKNAND